MYLSAVRSILLTCGMSMSVPAFAFAFAPHSVGRVQQHMFQLTTTSTSSSSTNPTTTTTTTRTTGITSARSPTLLSMSEWSSFQDLDDDDDLLYSNTNDDDLPPTGKMTQAGYADENDPQELKAEIGSKLPIPEIDWHGDPIFLPVGSALPLSEENVQGVLQACRQDIGTMFGYSAENRGVGITGGVDFVDFDGPTVILRIHGRFWHQRPTVLQRVGKYLQGRIPEIVDWTVEDEYELTDEANNNAD